MDIPYRVISTEGLKILGSGKSGVVYRIDAEKIVKIYREHFGESDARREFLFATLCQIAGIPAMKPYEIVRRGDACGVIYERLYGVSIKDLLIHEPQKVETFAALTACFMRENHRIAMPRDYGLSVRGIPEKWVGKTARIFSGTERAAIHTALETIPDRKCLLHMDPLPENLLLISPGHLAWIDLEECGIGHPAYSLQALFCPDFIENVPGISRIAGRVLMRYWEYFTRYYFAGIEKSRMPGILRGIRFLAYLRLLCSFRDMAGDTPFFRTQAGLFRETLFQDLIRGLDYNW